MKIFKLFFLLAIYSLALFGQNSEQFPQISQNNLSNCEIVTSKYYKGESLWGLINGGADVYLEYGFDKLLFQEVKWDNKNFRIEIYKMKSPESAFGIFSISKYKCNNKDSENRFVCITPYQVQGSIGKFYLSISNQVGDSLNQNATLKIYELIEKQIKKSEIQIPTKIKQHVNVENISKLKFIAGPLGVQNGFPNWSNLFDNIEGFSLFLHESEIGDDSIILAEIKFENIDESKIFINNAESFENIHHIEKLTNGNIFIIEGTISKEELKNIIE